MLRWDTLGKKVLQLTNEYFYWCKMEDDISHYVTNFCSCVNNKRPNITQEASMQTITFHSPLEPIGIDFLHLDINISSGYLWGYQNILVITDHFTRFTQVNPTTNKSFKTAAERLYNEFRMRYSFPGKILSDRGKELENNLLERS